MRHAFEYAVVRVVPRVERGEFVNAGVVLYCRGLDFLGAREALDADRLRALDRSADVDAVTAALRAFIGSCGGDGTGPAAAEQIGRRFRWLTAPRSTVVQPGPVHTGLTEDPDRELDRLLAVLVLPPS
jgi:hypothetical protein